MSLSLNNLFKPDFDIDHLIENLNYLRISEEVLQELLFVVSLHLTKEHVLNFTKI